MPQLPTVKPIEELTEDDFQAYEETRKSGRFNMLMPDAQRTSGLDRDTYFSVLHHYSALKKQFTTEALEARSGNSN